VSIALPSEHLPAFALGVNFVKKCFCLIHCKFIPPVRSMLRDQDEWSFPRLFSAPILLRKRLKYVLRHAGRGK